MAQPANAGDDSFKTGILVNAPFRPRRRALPRPQPVRRQFPRVGCVTATRPSHNLDGLFDALHEEVDVQYALTTVLVVLPNALGSISVFVVTSR